jgi:hypothetical protein
MTRLPIARTERIETWGSSLGESDYGCIKSSLAAIFGYVGEDS